MPLFAAAQHGTAQKAEGENVVFYRLPQPSNPELGARGGGIRLDLIGRPVRNACKPGAAHGSDASNRGGIRSLATSLGSNFARPPP